MEQLSRLRSFLCLWLCASLIGCAANTRNARGYTPQPGFEAYQEEEYRKGKAAAKVDLERGVLGFEDINGGEEEGWQVIWCYRKILKERHGIEYRCHGTSPGPVAYAAGYQSIVRPVIEAKLGSDWEARIFREAEAFHRDHWSEVAEVYRKEQWSGS